MLYEYAVDPGCLGEWEMFKYLIEQFGTSYGRLISDFPEDWLKLVDEVCKGFSFRRRQIMALEFIRLKEQALIRSGRPYDFNQTWKKNSIDQHQIMPFHAIITERNGEDPDYVLHAADIAKETPLWKVPREDAILRIPEALGAAAAPLLKMSRRILFVDKLFDPVIKKWQITLRHFIELAVNGRENLPSLEYHFKIDDEDLMLGGKEMELEQYCDECLANEIPTGIELRMFRWDDKPGGAGMHARYVLTERGGIRIDWGLDKGQMGQKTDVSLLDEDLWKERWLNYQEGSVELDLIEIASIIGRG